MRHTASDHVPPDPFNLARFVLEQEGIYPTALAELQAGRKRTHWMWFIFPQVAGLGSSPMAEMFAINSLEEARAYLAHPLLGPRLLRCASALLAHRGKQMVDIMGGVDTLKLRSCMTLFAALGQDGSQFTAVLDTFFNGESDPMTDEVMATWDRT